MEANDDKLLFTPKVIKSVMMTSTVDRTKSQRRGDDTDVNSHVDSSLGILSLNNLDISDILDVSKRKESVDQILMQQRKLANNTLSRASRVSAIPSKFLKPDLLQTRNETNANHFDSTVSESDLLQTPKNTSTPRNSSSEMDMMRMEPPNPRESIFSRFRDILDSDISFKQIVQANKGTMDSGLFLPPEEAASKLLADEVSWKRKHDIPVSENFTLSQESKDSQSMSIGEFFKQGSENISVFRATSPSRSEPVALIDSTFASNSTRDFVGRDETNIEPSRSLSVSAIQHLLAEAEDTPTKVMDYLFKQRRKPTMEKNSLQRESSEILSLPVSRDTSYTTSFSDNEAVRVAAKENKENINPSTRDIIKTQVVVNQPIARVDSCASSQKSFSPPSRSSSSLTSLPDGKLPVESTVGELVWGCVKVDRCVTKQFVLRNKTPKTLKLQCTVSSYDFKIRKENRSDSEQLSTLKFVLHGHESRALNISYIPTKIGPAIDELLFLPSDTNLCQTKKQCIRLYGYGGYTNTEYQNASRDNTGKFWLSLGRMDNTANMEQLFTIKNTGNLPSFTHIKLVPKHIVTRTNLKVEPNLFVLLPNEEKSVKVTYILSAKDCRTLKQNNMVAPVIDIGKLEIVSGSEVNRGRLRRLYRKNVEIGADVDDLAKLLSEKINGEIFPSDISKFKETPKAIGDILDTLNNEEMVLTIEQDPNQTLVAEYLENTISYQSLCQSTIVIDETSVAQKACRLEPPSLLLFPPNKTEDCLFLISESSKTLQFEVVSEPKGLHLSPTEGAITPGETTEIKIKSPRHFSEKIFKIQVNIENEILESEVKILNVRSSRSTFLE